MHDVINNVLDWDKFDKIKFYHNVPFVRNYAIIAYTRIHLYKTLQPRTFLMQEPTA